MRRVILGAVVACATLVTGSALAGHGIPAATIDRVESVFGGSNWNLGWSFTVDQATTVAGLGYFDDNGDGLNASHDVAIWRERDQAMLVSGTVNPGDTLDGLFRYTAVNNGPTLVPGEVYIVAGTSDARDMESQNNDTTYASGINYVGARWANTGTLAFPDQFATRTSGYHGATFSLVPAPGAIALLGIAGLAARRRRRS